MAFGGRVSRRSFVLGNALVALFRSRAVAAAVDTHVIVANPSVGDVALTLEDARKIFGARQELWPNGIQVLLVVPPKGSTSLAWLLERIVDMPEGAYRRHLMNQVFKGAVRQPIAATSTEDVVREVSSKRGAVSVLPLALVTPALAVLRLK
jgi:hypothetical protein